MRAAAQFVSACWVLFTVVWAVAAFWVKPAKERQPLGNRGLHLLLVGLAAFLIFGTIKGGLLAARIIPRSKTSEIIASALVFAGLVLALWARAALGRNWSGRITLKEGHELAQQGPYRLVRHPIYSGLLMMAFGTAILGGHVGAFLAVILYPCGLWLKLRQEEKLLTTYFPGYTEYMSRTKALIPFVF